MLVLTRRENEKILFPDHEIAVELISINGSRARVGIQAPSDVRVLREEIANEEDLKPRRRKLSHAIRNRLNATSIAAQLVRKQFERGMLTEAGETMRMLVEELDDLKSELTQSSVLEPQQAVDGEPKKQTALLVEDNANERQLLAGYLKMAGFEVVTAGDGEDALAYLADHQQPDVVLMDMYRPRCDGPTAIGEIRRNPKLSGLKIFAVSGTSPGTLGLPTGPGGIDRWFNKPINPEELASAMARELLVTRQSA